MALVVGIYLIASPGSSTKQVPATSLRGVLILNDASGISGEPTNGASCTGGTGYTDLKAGAAVVVTAHGHKVATTHLDPGTYSTTALGCLFDFEAAVPKGDGKYTITVTHRRPVEVQESQLANAQLTVGK